MTENELWTGCVTDFRALDAGRKKSWGWEPDFRALDLGRKKSRVWEPIFHALDPKNEKSRVREREKEVYITPKNKPWSGLRGRKDHAGPGKEERPGPRVHFPCARPESERKKFT